jgi:hypothetical protein
LNRSRETLTRVTTSKFVYRGLENQLPELKCGVTPTNPKLKGETVKCVLMVRTQRGVRIHHYYILDYYVWPPALEALLLPAAYRLAYGIA